LLLTDYRLLITDYCLLLTNTVYRPTENTMKPSEPLTPEIESATRPVKIHRIGANGMASEAFDDHVVFEHTVTIMVKDVGSFTLMCTPTDVKALAVGFAFAEGMIDSFNDIVDIAVAKDDPNVVAIEVEDPSHVTTRRNMIVATSCGMCGQRTLEALLTRTEPCQFTTTIAPENLLAVTDHLLAMQDLFRATGGSHAAGVFDTDGNVVAFGEDIGRHTALDKAIGKCLLAGRNPAGCVAALSGRASFEMVAKAARAGIEIVAAVSAPSSFAVEAAEKWGVTLCGFVRPPRANVYTHAERIVTPGESEQ